LSAYISTYSTTDVSANNLTIRAALYSAYHATNFKAIYSTNWFTDDATHNPTNFSTIK
jgi:hypothetical protein